MRADARINLILDEIVRTLSLINGDPLYWLTQPKTVKRWSRNPMAEPMPSIFVGCKEWGPNEPQTGYQHDGKASIEILCTCMWGEGELDDPARELHRVVADEISALETNWELKDATDTRVVPALQMHIVGGYEPAVTLGENGLAQATLEFVVLWPWVADTP